ncbi:glycine cleavage system protein GcvH [Planctomonas psychrotolerans]|uniref:glycine cleavage system protein GcvH n=1 Tax=Planctomonas psychrotolerans TaxID=2528712 RepID=UPI00123A750F|nr:glycine cleavage system protein GcvH [Planctomonas psychrotolerans]
MTTNERKYTPDHEWITVDGDIATIGITAYAADRLGDVVFIELPEAGADVAGGTVVGEIESTKSVGELFAPVDGTVIEVNTAAIDEPAIVNRDPLGDGWLIRVRFTALPDLLDADQYAALVSR